MRDFVLLIVMICVSGCASVSGKNKNLAINNGYLLNTDNGETVHDAASALTAVTGSVSHKDLSEQDLYEAAKQMHDDPEAKSAVEAISSTFDHDQVQVKYSPATGKRYSADMEIDPETGVELLSVD